MTAPRRCILIVEVSGGPSMVFVAPEDRALMVNRVDVDDIDAAHALARQYGVVLIDSREACQCPDLCGRDHQGNDCDEGPRTIVEYIIKVDGGGPRHFAMCADCAYEVVSVRGMGMPVGGEMPPCEACGQPTPVPLKDRLDEGDPDRCANCDRRLPVTASTAPRRHPHADTGGYVTERESRHPKLPGHFMVIDRTRGGDWVDADHRWVVVHINGDACGCIVSMRTKRSAIDLMIDMAAGGDTADFGQHEEAR